MPYILLFLEGIITFISPCMLPMLPIYVSYFAGGGNSASKVAALKNAVGFVIGFTLVFVTLGAFAGSIGKLLTVYSTQVNIVTGLIVIVFGLNFLGILNIPLLNRQTQKRGINVKELGFVSSVLFGIVFSIGWTPCVGAFLGSALMMASQQGSVIQGMIMLFLFSMGLGVPFIISAVLIDRLKSTFDFIKKHYRIINILSGGLLVVIGIFMMTGVMGYYLSMLTF